MLKFNTALSFSPLFPDRYALVLGAKTIYLTYLLLIVTFPLAYPISKAIAFILGPVPGISYSRDELRQLLILTHHRTDMGKAEVDMLMGALQVCTVVCATID